MRDSVCCVIIVWNLVKGVAVNDTLVKFVTRFFSGRYITCDEIYKVGNGVSVVNSFKVLSSFHSFGVCILNNITPKRQSITVTSRVRHGVSNQRQHDFEKHQGAVSIRKTVLPGMAIPMLKIRRPNGRLIFNMEIAIRR